MKIKKIACFAGASVLLLGATVHAEDISKRIYPVYDTYIDMSKPSTNYGKEPLMLLKPVYGNYAERETNPRSYGLMRFDVSEWTEEDIKNAACIKLKVRTYSDVNESITTNGLDAADYTLITDDPMGDVLQVLGLQRGVKLDGDTEIEINYKTSWDENTTWDTAGGLQLPANGNMLRGGIVDACRKETTYYIDVTDYVVYSALYEEGEGKDVVSFKLQKMLQNYLWNENKFLNGFSIYTKEAQDPEKRPELLLYTLSDEELIQEMFDSLDLGDTSAVYTDLELPTNYNNISVVWSTSDPSAITADGKVSIGNEDKNVTLTATATLNDTQITKTFNVTVKSADYVRSILEAEAKKITFQTFSKEPVNRVTSNLTIPAELIKGCVAEYSTSDESVLAINGLTGNVVRSEDDTKVTFKVKLYYPSLPDVFVEHTYNITVKGTKSSSGGAGGGGAGGGGATTPGKDPGITPPTISGNTPISPNPDSSTGSNSSWIFNDVPDDLWSQPYIAVLKNKGIVSGDENNCYRPNDSIKREETVKILALAFGVYDENAMCEFEDVPEGAWYYSYIASAFNAKIIKGISDTAFGTGFNVTRQDLAVMLYNAIEHEASETENKEFTDESDIADYAKEAVHYLRSKSIINGYEDGTFRPQNPASRAEVAKMVASLIAD